MGGNRHHDGRAWTVSPARRCGRCYLSRPILRGLFLGGSLAAWLIPTPGMEAGESQPATNVPYRLTETVISSEASGETKSAGYVRVGDETFYIYRKPSTAQRIQRSWSNTWSGLRALYSPQTSPSARSGTGAAALTNVAAAAEAPLVGGDVRETLAGHLSAFMRRIWRGLSDEESDPWVKSAVAGAILACVTLLVWNVLRRRLRSAEGLVSRVISPWRQRRLARRLQAASVPVAPPAVDAVAPPPEPQYVSEMPMPSGSTNAALSGSVASIALPALIQMLSAERSNGTLHVEKPDGRILGSMVFVRGRLITAFCPPTGEEGLDALCAMLRLHRGTFSFRPDEMPVCHTTFGDDVTGLLLEATRRLDEAAAPPAA